MRNNNFFMHQECQDVCVEVLRIRYNNENKIVAQVHWWNLGYTGKPWRLTQKPQTIEISRAARVNWHNVTDRLDVPRTAPGLP